MGEVITFRYRRVAFLAAGLVVLAFAAAASILSWPLALGGAPPTSATVAIDERTHQNEQNEVLGGGGVDDVVGGSGVDDTPSEPPVVEEPQGEPEGGAGGGTAPPSSRLALASNSANISSGPDDIVELPEDLGAPAGGWQSGTLEPDAQEEGEFYRVEPLQATPTGRA